MVVLVSSALGFGWLLTRVISDFSLFEASLLTLIALVFVLHIAYHLLRLPVVTNLEEIEDDEEDEEEDEEDYPIPIERFHKSNQPEIVEDSFRYEIANAIYRTLAKSPKARGAMSDSQLKELSIRLIDIAVAILKRRPRNIPRVHVSTAALRHEMERIEQKPYDDTILEEAAAAINEELEANDELADVIRHKNWKELMLH